MDKTSNQKAWLFVAPVVVLVAFNALIPLMTVVNYSVQETFGDKRLPKRATKLGALHQADLGGDDAAWGYGVAGDNNFDPLELYGTFGDDAEGRKAMRDAEIANGRLAMVAIAFAAFFEAVSGAPVTTIFHRHGDCGTASASHAACVLPIAPPRVSTRKISASVPHLRALNAWRVTLSSSASGQHSCIAASAGASSPRGSAASFLLVRERRLSLSDLVVACSSAASAAAAPLASSDHATSVPADASSARMRGSRICVSWSSFA